MMSQMDDDDFWAIIESARTHGPTLDDRATGLRLALEGLDAEQILEFHEAFIAKRDAAKTYDLVGAAILLADGCSDDGFTDFRVWLVSTGRQRYERALLDADSLADVEFGPGAEEYMLFEEFAHVAMEVYEAKTGDYRPSWPYTGPRQPLGDPWDEERELATRLPRLWKAARGKDGQ